MRRIAIGPISPRADFLPAFGSPAQREAPLSLITGQPEETSADLIGFEGFGFAASDRSGVDLRHTSLLGDGRHGPG